MRKLILACLLLNLTGCSGGWYMSKDNDGSLRGVVIGSFLTDKSIAKMHASGDKEKREFDLEGYKSKESKAIDLANNAIKLVKP